VGSQRWARSRIRSILRSVALTLLAAVDRRKPHGVTNLFFHAIPEEQARSFEQFLDRLRKMGPVVSLEEAQHRRDTAPVFTISFDDGFKSTFEVAGRILHSRGIPSTVFVASELIGLNGAQLEKFTHERLNWPHVQAAMTAADLRAAPGQGMEIGSHGVSHRSFATLTGDEAMSELVVSKSVLEEQCGHKVRFFAWPFGSLSDFPERCVALAKQAGYEAVYSAVGRRAHLPQGVQPRRELNLSWGLNICLYLARRG
jgi:peptidoglycan/xylan/chitin deacetylase (PgdA/CDA1 family)